MAMCMALIGCQGKNQPVQPEPTPIPTPNGMEKLEFSLTNGGFISGGKLYKDWKVNDEVKVWGFAKENTKPLALSTAWMVNGQWTAIYPLPDEWKSVEKITMAYSPNNTTFDPSQSSLSPRMETNKMIGAYCLSQYYDDFILGAVINPIGRVTTTLSSPYSQVELILQNSTFPQKISDIELEIEGFLANAILTEKGWSGKPTTLKVNYKDKAEKWKGKEADTLFMAIPTVLQKLNATLHYTTSEGKHVIEKELVLSKSGVSQLLITFPKQIINNPPLAFKLPIDSDYWKNANQNAWDLLHANYSGEHDEKLAREYYGWVTVKPLTDMLIHTKTLYKDDANIIGWQVELNESYENDLRDWGLIFGLETLDGTLMEVYPPLYFANIGGVTNTAFMGGYLYNLGTYDNYCYVTVPEGEYRLVCFVKYHKDYIGKKMSEKWFKLPPIDSRNALEINWIYSKENIKKYLHQPIQWDKSIYNGLEKVKVVDRIVDHSTAPRWCMGMTYNNKEDYLNKKPSFDTYQPPIARKINKGCILEATIINNSNNVLRGTIVAKAEYLPMFNPIGDWRFDLYKNLRADINVNTLHKEWSHEVGRTAVTLTPNSKEVVSVEVINFNWRWRNDGNCDKLLGPKEYIHLYWLDANGNIEMMKRVDYTYLNNAQNDDFGNPKKNHSLKIDKGLCNDLKWYEQEVGYGPASDCANGFEVY